MPSSSRMVSTVSIEPATYIQVAGGLNLAALKKFSVAGSVNLPITCGRKNSAQASRRITVPSSRLNLSAQDTRFPRCDDCGAFQWIAAQRARVGELSHHTGVIHRPQKKSGAGRRLLFPS